MTQIISLIALVIFAGMMVFIGLYTMKRSKTMDGFLLGGRNIGPWFSAFAYGTSYFSAVIFVGYAGKFGWDIGFPAMWIGIGNCVFGCFLAWKLLAKKTRDMTHKLNTRTMPEFFEARYGSKAMKIYSALIVFIFLMPYAASVYKGLGAIFGAIFPNLDLFGLTPTNVCLIFVAVFTAVYLVLGGLSAIAISDFIQGILMVAGVIIMAFAIVSHPNVGGLSEAASKLKEINPQLVSVFGGDNIKFLLTNILLTSFGVWGLPQMVNKYYSVKDDESIKKATIISTAISFIIGCGAYFIGVFGRFFTEGNNTLPEGGYDAVVPNMLMSAFGGENILGNILLSIILLCVLSASMSTLSSVVLVSSSALTVDLIAVANPAFKKNSQTFLTRIICFVFIILSLVFAMFNFSIIVSIMSYSWGIVAGSFIGPFLWGLNSKKITKAGAWSGLVSSVLIVGGCVVYGMINPPAAAVGKSAYEIFKAVSGNSPQFGIAAMIASVIIVPVVSIFTRKYDEKFIGGIFG